MFIYKKQAVKLAGNKKKLAELLDITPQAVQHWSENDPIPQKQAIKLVALYGEGAFK